MVWQIGEKIENRYEIHNIKGGEGKSGFGIVYICYDPQDKIAFALKTFQAKFLSSQKAQDEFREEALTWIRLDKHKNIVRAHYVKNIEGQPYIFLEYVAGGNLDDWLYTKQLDDWLYTKQLDLPLALNFALQFCTGMDYAYQKMGLIHRDIKPSNILLTQDKTVKITDFGLAKTLEVQPEQVKVPSDLSYVQTTTAGTFPYMAPEQFTDQKIDTRADIYSFGIVLYQMVTMSYPYPKRSSWFEMHVKEAPLPIRQSISADLTDLIHKCLQKNPDDRYQNFSGLRHDLSQIYVDVTGETIPEESDEVLKVGELINKGLTLVSLDRSEEALACYNKALDINPRDAEAWDNIGVALFNLGHVEKALACYQEALDINPQHAEAWGNIGVALSNLGHVEEALACYEKVLDINPRKADAWYNKGVGLGVLDRHEEAVACYEKVLDINPREAGALYNKGVALSNLGHVEEALTCYEKVLDINPLHAKAWYCKGDKLRNLGCTEEEIACYDKALDINPRYAEAWYNKGFALSKQAISSSGMAEEAISAFKQFIKYAPPQYASRIKQVKEIIQQLKRMV